MPTVPAILVSATLSPTLRCDLHCHSCHSDGAGKPAEVAAAMAASGVEVFALTDHDTLSGVAAAQAAARALGIRCLAGIELSIQWAAGTFHLLGLGIQQPKALDSRLAQLQQQRILRNEAICDKLRRLGIAIHREGLEAYAAKEPGGVLNRSHIASYLVDKGHCATYEETFKRYLAVGAAAYVAIDAPSPEQGIAWIQAAGGYAFIAHPHSLNLGWQRFANCVRLWRSAGLDGLEISHPRTSSKDSQRLLHLCQSLEMHYSGGSDYHRGATAGVLGQGSGGKAIVIPRHFGYLREYSSM